MLLMMPFSSVSATLITYCSQNLGAGKYARIRKGIKDCMLIMLVWATLAVVLVFLGGHALVGMIVTDTDNSGYRGAVLKVGGSILLSSGGIAGITLCAAGLG